MKSLLLSVLVLTGCATADPDVIKSASRDKTMENMARAALIDNMLRSQDPVVRSKGADAAAEFVKKEKRSFFD